jgi:DNA/RNA endonuclease G (NUC1)
LATLSQLWWDKEAAEATNTYVNTVPTRQPFDGGQWNARESKNSQYAKKHGKVFVVKGPSLEFDGVTKEGLEVPSMLWAAIYDPRKRAARGWTFRNGLQQPKNKQFNSDSGIPGLGCFGADGLSTKDIESVVGLKMWPGIPASTGLLEW